MENKRTAIICDLDGTLCLFEKQDKTAAHYRNPYDASTCGNDLVNQAVLKVLYSYSGYDIALGREVIFVSGREDKYRMQTTEWLNKHGIFNYSLFMRKSGDFRKDSVIKQEIYETYIKPNFDIDFVLDDRDQVVKMWREQGLVCFQVAEGNF